MANTVFVRGAGGALWEMDVPTEGFALERWTYQLEKGEIAIVPAAEWVTDPDGTRRLVEAQPDAAPAPASEEPADPDADPDVEPVKAKGRKG